MKFAIYGVSRSGKDYFIDALVRYFAKNGENLYHIKGAETLNKLALEIYGVKFGLCNDTQKCDLRERFVEFLNKINDTYKYIIVDGHYAFFDENKKFYSVCTESDIKSYDKFFYLDSESRDIVERMKKSTDSKYNDSLTEKDIENWKNYEIEQFTDELLKHDKELHIICYDNENALHYVFDCVTKDEYNSKSIAKAMVENLKLNTSCVVLTDCDKTLSKEDSAILALENAKQSKNVLKEIFKNDRYSNFQMWRANSYLKDIDLFTEESKRTVAEKITANRKLIDNLLELHDIPVIAITAGDGSLWEHILRNFGLNIPLLAHKGMLVSKFVKYFVVKEMQKRGIFVIAIGDSLLDGLMLKQANKSYLVTVKGHRENIELFLKQNGEINQIEYFPVCYPGNPHEKTVTPIKTLTLSESVSAEIAVCKSDSAIIGKKLRESHYYLGKEVAKMIHADFTKDQFVIVVMLRSGLPFSFGIADYFDCSVLFFDEYNIESFVRQLHENVQLSGKTFIISDAVVNSGKSVKKLVEMLKNQKCIIATNVLSDKCSLEVKFPIYASRISKRSFVGSKQKNIENGKGPDTGDRLFNLIS